MNSWGLMSFTVCAVEVAILSPAAAAAVVRKEEVRMARVLWRRACESGARKEFIRGGLGYEPSDDGFGRLGWIDWVGCRLGLENGWWAQVDRALSCFLYQKIHNVSLSYTVYMLVRN